MARRAGSRALLSLWPEEDPARIWLATTDADSRVPQDWLTVQLEAYLSGADMWAGRVRVAEEECDSACGGQSDIRPNGIRCTARASVSAPLCTRSLEASAACALGKIGISIAEPWQRAFGSPMTSGRR